MKELFKKIITDFQESTFKPIILRDVQIPLESGKIVSLVGVRRSGKTSLLYQLIEDLRSRVSKTHIVYVNFEDDRLFPLELRHLNDLMEACYELHPQNRDQKVWLFLDEIQNVQNWELFTSCKFSSDAFVRQPQLVALTPSEPTTGSNHPNFITGKFTGGFFSRGFPDARTPVGFAISHGGVG